MVPDHPCPLQALEQPAVDHGAGPHHGLLGRLEDEEVPAGKVVRPPGEYPGGAEEHRGVRVVAARVHPTLDHRAEAHRRPLVHREGVDVGPQDHRLAPMSALEHEGRTGGRGHRALDEAEGGGARPDEGGGGVLFGAELGVRVQVASGVDHLVEGGVDARRAARRPVGGAGHASAAGGAMTAPHEHAQGVVEQRPLVRRLGQEGQQLGVVGDRRRPSRAPRALRPEPAGARPGGRSGPSRRPGSRWPGRPGPRRCPPHRPPSARGRGPAGPAGRGRRCDPAGGPGPPGRPARAVSAAGTGRSTPAGPRARGRAPSPRPSRR